MSINLPINFIENPIDRKETGEGKASAITALGSKLSRKQRRLLEKLPKYRSLAVVHKRDVSMYDLAALTAVTEVEYALFTCSGRRLVVRGDYRHVDMTFEEAKKLSAAGYRWSGHTHPGFTRLCLSASEGDKETLKCFFHELSVIYNSNGTHHVFDTLI